MSHRSTTGIRPGLRRIVRRIIDPPQPGPLFVFRSPTVARSALFGYHEPPPDQPLETFPVPGQLGGSDLRGVKIHRDTITFVKPGEYYLRTNRAARKVLALDPTCGQQAQLLAVFAFVARSVVHAQTDSWRAEDTPRGLFGLATGQVRPDKLLDKFFCSDQPLGLHCWHSSCFLNDILHLLGWRARLVNLQDDQGRGHVVSEGYVEETDRWVMLDVDYGAVVVDHEGAPLSTAEIAEVLEVEPDALHVRDLAEKSRLLTLHDGAPAPSFRWSPLTCSEQKMVNESSYRKLLTSYTHELQFWEYRERFSLAFAGGRIRS